MRGSSFPSQFKMQLSGLLDSLFNLFDFQNMAYLFSLVLHINKINIYVALHFASDNIPSCLLFPFAIRCHQCIGSEIDMLAY